MPPSGEPIAAWLDATRSLGGTDLHLAPGRPPSIRLGGRLVPIEGEPDLTAADTARIVDQVLGSLAARIEEQGDVDFSFSWRDEARFRGNAYWQRGSMAMALRHIPYDIPGPDQLGLPPVIDQFLNAAGGLVVVTGPTGSGKTTTLASMVDQINRRRACHILTLEEPVEYLHRHHKAMVNQREIGVDAASFTEGLRAALREDPDVLLVGEMRDVESIQATLTIAETGHLVLATLHTNDTAQVVDRIVDVFPAERRPQIQVQLASTLQGVIYQRLVPTVDGQLVAAFEVMVANHAVRNLIREGKSRQLRNVVATGQGDGMQTLEMSLSDLVASGRLDHETAAGVSLYPGEIARSRRARPVVAQER